MAGPQQRTVKAFAPDGTPIEVPVSEVKGGNLQSAGGALMTEQQARQAQRSREEDAKPIADTVAETLTALHIGRARGLGESFGIPVDRFAVETGRAFGKGEAVKQRLKEYDEKHGFASGLGEFAGQAAGITAQSALMPAAAPESAGARIVQGAGRMGLENAVIGSTHDLNEEALGKPKASGEKVFAHYAIGAGAGLLFGAGGEAIKRALPGAQAAADSAATRAIGRELGESGERALAAGEYVKALNQGRMPEVENLAAILEREQGAQRSRSLAERAGLLDSIATKQTREAAALEMEREAARKAVARRHMGQPATNPTGEVGIPASEVGRAPAGVAVADGAGAAVRSAEEAAAARIGEAEVQASYMVDQAIAREARKANALAESAERAAAERGERVPQSLDFEGPMQPSERSAQAVRDLEASLQELDARKQALARGPDLPEGPMQPGMRARELEAVRSEYQGKVREFGESRASAEEAVSRLETEYATQSKKLQEVASRLDQVSGATRPDGNRIMSRVQEIVSADEALFNFSPGAQKELVPWIEQLSRRVDSTGRLTFKETQHALRSLDELERRARVYSGIGADENLVTFSRAFKTALREEFEAASETTAASVSGAAELNVGRLRKTVSGLSEARDKAYDVLSEVQKVQSQMERLYMGAEGRPGKIQVLEMQAKAEPFKAQLKAEDEARRAHAAALESTQTAERTIEKRMDSAMRKAQDEAFQAVKREGSQVRQLSDVDRIKAEKAFRDQLRDGRKTVEQVRAEARKLVGLAKAEGDAEIRAAKAAAKGEVKAERKSFAEAAKAAREAVRDAEREARDAVRQNEKLYTAKERALEASQKAELKAVPKASKETTVDTLLGRTKARAVEREGTPLIGRNAGMMGALSLLHGNVGGAALALGGSVMAGITRAHGNAAIAKTMTSLAGALGRVDRAIKDGVARALGKAIVEPGASALERALSDEPAPRKAKMPSFDEAYKSVREMDPAKMAARIEQTAPWAKDAPQTYAAMLATAMRAQQFLSAKLPPPNTDKFSLTPHLEKPAISDSAKHDFMEYVKTIQDPLVTLKGVGDGTLTPQQVEALQAVYPEMYTQMREELQRQLSQLRQPVEYTRAVHIGTLLQVVTVEELDPGFQATMRASYARKQEQGAGAGQGSKAPPGDSKVAKSVMSTSEKVERGDF